jgi:hypothetical integral membrane protein (TIGR02206 family)
MRVMDILPFELCSALFFANAYGLWTGNRIALDMMWFWAMGAVLHAYITPTPRAGYPDLNYFQYFIAHGLLLFTAVFGTVGLGRRPGRGGVRRASGALLAFTALVAVVDLVTGENYLYLRHKPPSPTLADAFGPWPTYVVVGLAVATISFAVWAMPWIVVRRMASRRDQLGLPPGPRTPGFFQLARFALRPIEFFDSCSKFGDLFTVDMASFGKFVMVSSPTLIKQVFTGNPDVFLAGRANQDFEPLLGARSVFLLDGSEHVRHRRLLMPPFHRDRIRTYAEIMRDEAQLAIARMPKGNTFPMLSFTKDIALGILLRAVFGLEHGFARDRMSAALGRYLEPPSPFLPFLPKVDLPLSPYRQFLRLREAVDREIYLLLAARRGGHDTSGEDVVSMLLAARDDTGRPLTDRELRDEIVTLLVAGHETTAATLCWCLERLLLHPEALARLDAELATVDTPEATAQLPYLDAVVRETLRMRPVLPDVVRELATPYQLGGWLLPVGTRVSPCIHLAHRHECSWPEPDAFRPERFLDATVDPYAWIPFGGGSRRCIGLAFALYEIKVVLATMLREARFRLELARSLRIVRRGVTLGPEGGMRVVRVETREVTA